VKKFFLKKKKGKKKRAFEIILNKMFM